MHTLFLYPNLHCQTTKKCHLIIIDTDQNGTPARQKKNCTSIFSIRCYDVKFTAQCTPKTPHR